MLVYCLSWNLQQETKMERCICVIRGKPGRPGKNRMEERHQSAGLRRGGCPWAAVGSRGRSVIRSEQSWAVLRAWPHGAFTSDRNLNHHQKCSQTRNTTVLWCVEELHIDVLNQNSAAWHFESQTETAFLHCSPWAGSSRRGRCPPQTSLAAGDGTSQRSSRLRWQRTMQVRLKDVILFLGGGGGEFLLKSEWWRTRGVFPAADWTGSLAVASFSGSIPAKHLSVCLIKSCEKFKGLESMQLNALLGTKY